MGHSVQAAAPAAVRVGRYHEERTNLSEEERRKVRKDETKFSIQAKFHDKVGQALIARLLLVLHLDLYDGMGFLGEARTNQIEIQTLTRGTCVLKHEPHHDHISPA